MEGLLHVFYCIAAGAIIYALIAKAISAVIGFCFKIIGAFFYAIGWVISAPFRWLFRFLF